MRRARGKARAVDADGLDARVAWLVRRAAGDAVSLLQRAARAAAAAEGARGGSLSIAVVGARRMASLHLRHSGISGPTDVLTFDLSRGNRLDGEIVVCAAVAARRAAERGIPFASELALYVVHGVLHLCGYDDHTPRGFQRMHAREDEVLARLGLGRVFRAEPPNRAELSTARPRPRPA